MACVYCIANFVRHWNARDCSCCDVIGHYQIMVMVQTRYTDVPRPSRFTCEGLARLYLYKCIFWYVKCKEVGTTLVLCRLIRIISYYLVWNAFVQPNRPDKVNKKYVVAGR